MVKYMSLIKNYLDFAIIKAKILFYRRTIPKRVVSLRKKEHIRTVFMLSDVSLWKTEGLFIAMREHPRFLPILAVTPMNAVPASEPNKRYNRLKDYLHEKGYDFVEINKDNFKSLNPNIILYQQPYEGFLPKELSFREVINNALVVHVAYGIHTLSAIPKHSFSDDQPLHRYAWQLYMENEETLVCGKYTLLKGSNMVVTGVPMQDLLISSIGLKNTSWKSQSSKKKRIIWAPHHTLPIKGAYNFINLSTFLDVYEIMLEMADMYKDTVQFAFKPHPFLKKKLYFYWGKEKTEAYYAEWSNRENTQISEGEYLNLFSNSDALIHDCNSFQVEYCYTCKPCLFLIHPHNINNQLDELNDFGKRVFRMHDFGITRDDIEAFILRVVSGEDIRKQERESLFNNYLCPPNNKTASENIINAILGEEEYANIN